MKKNIPVIIKENTPKLGKAGQIINVTSGHAFNYLIPNKIAELAGKGTLKHAQMLANIRIKKAENIRIEAKKLQQKLEQISKISIKKKTGDQQHIFGSISDKEISEEILKYTGVKIERKQVKIPEIKTTGIYPITIQILDDIIVNIKLQVLPIDI